MAKKKRRLKKSVKISLILVVLIVALSGAGYSYYVKMTTPEVKPTYGKIGSYNGNSEVGKIDVGEKEEAALPELTYIVFDVGDGYSIFIDYQNTEVLIDAGKKGNKVAKGIKPYIKDELDYVIASSSSPNKIGGLPVIYKNFKVNNTIYNGDDKNPEIAKLLKAAEKSHVEKGRDNNIVLGTGATVTIFDVTNGAKNDKDNSLATVLSYGDSKFAETGDMSEQFAARLVNKLEGATVLTTSEYGSIKLLQALQPKYYAISTGKKIPTKSMDEMTSVATVFSTKANGTIIFKSDGNEVTSNKDNKEY